MAVPATNMDALKIENAQLPVVDLTGLFDGDIKSVATELGKAARTSGFFYISGHGVPQETVDAMFAASKPGQRNIS